LDTGHFGYRHNPENFKNRENVMRKMILSNYIRFFEQWGYEEDISSDEKLIPFPIAYPTTGLSLAVAITFWGTLCSTDSLTAVNFRYRGNKDKLPNIRWISLGY
jgi:hypothetical protein